MSKQKIQAQKQQIAIDKDPKCFYTIDIIF